MCAFLAEGSVVEEVASQFSSVLESTAPSDDEKSTALWCVSQVPLVADSKKMSDRDLSTCCNLLAIHFSSTGSNEVKNPLIQLISHISKHIREEEAVLVLADVFNYVEGLNVKWDCLDALLNVLEKCSQETVTLFAPQLERLFKASEASGPHVQASFVKRTISLLSRSGNLGAASRIGLSYLLHIEDKTPEVVDLCCDFLRIVISDESFFDFGLLSDDTILASVKDANERLYGLLSVCRSGSYGDYKMIKKKYVSIWEDIGVVEEFLDSRIRVLALMTLASECRAMSFEEVSTALDTSEKEVERCIVRAVATGFVKARMDQLNKKVMFSGSTRKAFDEESWKKLKTELEVWKERGENVIEQFRNSCEE